jgi:hypothetical protein
MECGEHEAKPQDKVVMRERRIFAGKRRSWWRGYSGLR